MEQSQTPVNISVTTTKAVENNIWLVFSLKPFYNCCDWDFMARDNDMMLSSCYIQQVDNIKVDISQAIARGEQ